MEKKILLKRCGVIFVMFLFISLLFSFASPGCKGKKSEENQGKGKERPKEKILNVKVQPVEKKSLRPFIKTHGSLNAFDEVIVSSEIDGILKTVVVEEGSVVTKGMLLAAINESDYKLQVQQAKAVLKQAAATFQNASVDYRRKQSLAKEELLTNQQFDDASTKLSLAEADVERAKATLDMALDKTAKTSIHSPLSGVIKEKKISAGSYVKSATPLFTIIQIHPLKLFFTITEKEIGRIKQGQDVNFTVDSFTEQTFTGKVKTIYPNLEESTRTLKIDATVPNSDSILKPGLFANVILYTGDLKDVLLVPVVSIVYDDSKTKVFVVEKSVGVDNMVREREVVAGAQYGDLMEITDGIAEKEIVVTAGHQNLSEGVKVHVDR
ncbi:MAG: efflux RND transporter periplasmic adaptor subunit [Desulfamplus sp.]|nr:efflux RND transporter periplasmic adaptor subunit [Desulfamplus sp.]